MALEITYWGSRNDAKSAPGSIISSEQRTLSGSSAQSGATPESATFVSILATEKARFAYGANPTAADTGANACIASGERLWLTAVPTYKIAGIQAA